MNMENLNTASKAYNSIKFDDVIEFRAWCLLYAVDLTTELKVERMKNSQLQRENSRLKHKAEKWDRKSAIEMSKWQ